MNDSRMFPLPFVCLDLNLEKGNSIELEWSSGDKSLFIFISHCGQEIHYLKSWKNGPEVIDIEFEDGEANNLNLKELVQWVYREG